MLPLSLTTTALDFNHSSYYLKLAETQDDDVRRGMPFGWSMRHNAIEHTIYDKPEKPAGEAEGVATLPTKGSENKSFSAPSSTASTAAATSVQDSTVFGPSLPSATAASTATQSNLPVPLSGVNTSASPLQSPSASVVSSTASTSAPSVKEIQSWKELWQLKRVDIEQHERKLQEVEQRYLSYLTHPRPDPVHQSFLFSQVEHQRKRVLLACEQETELLKRAPLQ